MTALTSFSFPVKGVKVTDSTILGQPQLAVYNPVYSTVQPWCALVLCNLLIVSSLEPLCSNDKILNTDSYITCHDVSSSKNTKRSDALYCFAIDIQYSGHRLCEPRRTRIERRLKSVPFIVHPYLFLDKIFKNISSSNFACTLVLYSPNMCQFFF